MLAPDVANMYPHKIPFRRQSFPDLGAKTADLAYKAITEGMDGMEDYYLMDGGIITVNTDTAAMIGKQAEYSCFDSMGTVVEVTTTKD